MSSKINPYPVTLEKEDLKNLNKVINRAHFEKNIEDNNKKIVDNHVEKKGSDKIECKICGRTYTRYNKSKHNKTNHHKFCEKLNDKWRDSILK